MGDLRLMRPSAMFAKQGPKLRNACEECHRRKTKCVRGKVGGSCMACETNNRECYFKQRLKSGRPYSTFSSQGRNNALVGTQLNGFEASSNSSAMGSPELSDQNFVTPDWSINSFDPMSQSGDGTLAQSSTGSGSSRNEDIPGMDFGMSDSRPAASSQIASFLSSIPAAPPPLQSSSSLYNNASNFGFASGFGPNPGPRTSLSLNAAEDIDSHGSISPSTHLLPPASRSLSRSQSSPSREDNTASSRGALTLEQCMELQQEMEAVREAFVETDHAVPHDETLHSISATMSTHCEKISTTVRRSVSSECVLTMDLALLIILMIRKALDLSSLFTRPGVQGARSLQYILFLKRLECNVMDLHISLSLIKQQQPTLVPVADNLLKDSATIVRQLQEIVAEMGGR